MGRHGRGMPGREPPGNVSQHIYASQRSTIYQAGGNQFISIGGVSTAARRRRIAGAAAAAGCLVVILTVTALIASHFTVAREVQGLTTAWTAPLNGAAVVAAAPAARPSATRPACSAARDAHHQPAPPWPSRRRHYRD
jgi:hypothetical protein